MQANKARFQVANRIIFLILLSFISTHIIAQQTSIQWAGKVEYQFNNYHEKHFSGLEVLGPPNAFPPGVLSQRAFRLKSDRSYGTIVISLNRPQNIQHVVIVENYNPGRLTQVKLKDTDGKYHLIYQKNAERIKQDFRTLIISMPRTMYKVETIELNINCITEPAIYQVDAIGVLDAEGLDVIKSELRGANFNIEQEVTFAEKKELLTEAINSRYTEVKPLVSHDGTTLYFSRLFSPDNVDGIADPQDIYFSKYLNGQWTKAFNIGAPLNDNLSNGICSISPDGNSILVINGYGPYGKVSPGVSISTKTASGWSKPRKIEILDFENKSKYQDFYLSPDQEHIILAIENDESHGDQDLFISNKTGPNQYSKPKNMGGIINTAKAEFSPFLSLDGRTLYFASEGHGGYGQSDIYKTTRLDESWQNWSPPKNMGPAVNTSSWDAYFSITSSGDYAYFVSSEGSRDGKENIYRIPLWQDQSDKPKTDLIAFTGRVINSKTNLPISSDVFLQNQDNHNAYRSISDKITGEFNIFVQAGRKHQFNVSAPGFIAFEDEVNLEGIQPGETMVKIVKLMPIEVGQVVTLNNLFFERGQANLLDKSMPTLDRLLQLMMENPSLEIELSGHTDGLGGRTANQVLSQDRVDRIKEYLVQFGIERGRISTIGFGGRYPVAPSDTEENRAKNRRVEVKIMQINS